jgi:hypothetical protein
VYSPLRFGEARGRPFATEADALMGGYSAACKIVDDLFCHDRHDLSAQDLTVTCSIPSPAGVNRRASIGALPVWPPARLTSISVAGRS